MDDMIQEMIHWIEANMTGSFSLNELSQAMGYSPYYCSFKFHQVTGMSIKRYVLLRKMYLAAMTLIETDERIIDIAINSGYTSQEAFSRSFKQVFGVNPREFRVSPEPLQTFAKLTLQGIEDVYQMNISQKLTIEAL